MKPHAAKLVALLCLPLSAQAIGFEEALRQARQHQAELDSKQAVRLATSLNQAMGKALTQCTPPHEKIPEDFAVVFRIGERGRVTATWTRRGTRFEHCFGAAMREGIKYVPPVTPFFAAIE